MASDQGVKGKLTQLPGREAFHLSDFNVLMLSESRRIQLMGIKLLFDASQEWFPLPACK